jgi:chaperone required for assembly of F1-ATPase
MKYIDADLLCYRAAYPADLKARQQTVWQPVLDWAAAAHGIAMTTTEGLMPASQPATAGEALRKAIAALDDERLTAFQACAAICNSLVLSLALAHGRISASEAFAASSLDETYQLEQWGEDELAVQRRRNIENDLLGIGEYLRLLKLP